MSCSSACAMSGVWKLGFLHMWQLKIANRSELYNMWQLGKYLKSSVYKIYQLTDPYRSNGPSLLVSVEPDQDFVTCGDCQREFLLSDFVKYIQHKVNRCNKENVEPYDGHDFEEDADPEATPSVITTQRTSISAPIQQEKLSPRPSIPSVSHEDDLPHLEKVDAASSQDRAPSRGRPDDVRCKPRLVDAESNTDPGKHFITRLIIHLIPSKQLTIHLSEGDVLQSLAH